MFGFVQGCSRALGAHGNNPAMDWSTMPVHENFLGYTPERVVAGGHGMSRGELLEGKVCPGTILLENTNCFPKLLYGLCFHWGEGFLLFNILVNHLRCQTSTKFLPILWYKMVFPETWLALQVSSVVKWLFTSSASFSMSSLFCTYWFIGEVYIFWNPTLVAYMLI